MRVVDFVRPLVGGGQMNRKNLFGRGVVGLKPLV
jgi:hypothetical protein